MSNELERQFIEGAARAMYVQAWADAEDLKCADCTFDGNMQTGGSSIEGAHELWLLENDHDMHPFRSRIGSGLELMDVAPPTPDYAREQAWKLLGRLEQANPQLGGNLPAITAAAARVDSAAFDEGAERRYPRQQLDDDEVRDFGHYIAMQALGHGVSWFDDHAEFELKIPHVEFEMED